MQHKFLVLGVPVFARVLPSGDLAVWHPYNEVLRAHVEPICRGRGYWQGSHNNWIVRRSYREQVLLALARAEGA